MVCRGGNLPGPGANGADPCPAILVAEQAAAAAVRGGGAEHGAALPRRAVGEVRSGGEAHAQQHRQTLRASARMLRASAWMLPACYFQFLSLFFFRFLSGRVRRSLLSDPSAREEINGRVKAAQDKVRAAERAVEQARHKMESEQKMADLDKRALLEANEAVTAAQHNAEEAARLLQREVKTRSNGVKKHPNRVKIRPSG
eukprot:5743865-Pyramimonas_sp.AAC.1